MPRFKPRFRLITLMGFVTACALGCWAYLEFVHVWRVRSLLAELGGENTQSADAGQKVRHAFDNLLAMGRRATPALVKAALERDPRFEKAREGPVPPGGHAFAWLSQNEDARSKSETERRADRALAALVRAWNAGWIPQAQQRRLLPYVHRWAVSLPASVLPQDGGPVTVDLGHFLPLQRCAIDDELWLRRRIVLLLDEQDKPEAIDFYEDGWVKYKAIEAVPPVGSRIISGRKGGTHVPTLYPEKLAPGKHTLTVKILLGPAEPPAPGKDTAETADPPPWHTEIALEPLKFEVVEANEANTDSDKTGANDAQP